MFLKCCFFKACLARRVVVDVGVVIRKKKRIAWQLAHREVAACDSSSEREFPPSPLSPVVCPSDSDFEPAPVGVFCFWYARNPWSKEPEPRSNLDRRRAWIEPGSTLGAQVHPPIPLSSSKMPTRYILPHTAASVGATVWRRQNCEDVLRYYRSGIGHRRSP